MSDNAPSKTRPTRLTHLDETGAASMVDVGDKAETRRIAVAEGFVKMAPETLALIRAGEAKKGDVIGIARIAGIMGAKRTHELIPLCHPLLLDKITVDVEPDDALVGLKVTALARVFGARRMGPLARSGKHAFEADAAFGTRRGLGGPLVLRFRGRAGIRFAVFRIVGLRRARALSLVLDQGLEQILRAARLRGVRRRA